MIYHKYLEKICSEETRTHDIQYKDDLMELVKKLLASKIQNIQHNKISLLYEEEQINKLKAEYIKCKLAEKMPDKMCEFIKLLDKNIEKFLEQNPQYNGETIYTDKNIHNFFTDHIMNNSTFPPVNLV